MKRKLGNLLLVAALLGLVLAPPAWADGSSYVIVAGRVGTPVTSLPFTITSQGFYYLKGNLNYRGSDTAITVDYNNVTLDLIGFTINGAGSSSGKGIYVSAKNNVEVRNGAVENFQ